MTTHFITAEIDLAESPAEIHAAVVAELERRGDPLRWAIVAVDAAAQKATVEAVVTHTVTTATDEVTTVDE